MTDIIPFGKYKGQEIEQVRMRDPQYLQWLTQQAWFQEKFAPVYQVVINNFAPPSEDTPAHNAIQVRFLDFAFRSAFFEALEYKIDWVTLGQRWVRNTRHLRAAPTPMLARKEWRREGTSPFWKRQREIHREHVRAIWATWRRIKTQPRNWCSIGNPKFETACDVEFEVRAAVGFKDEEFRHYIATEYYRLMIEIKPCMGDDYPAVLRQIKRQMAISTSEHGIIRQWVLLLDEFGSNSVTLEQVRSIFSHENIKIVLLAQVRDQLIAR